MIFDDNIIAVGSTERVLRVGRSDNVVRAYLYDGIEVPDDEWDHDRYALDLVELGQDPEDDWYDLDLTEIAGLIERSLTLTRQAAALEAERQAVAKDPTIVDGLADWAQAGLTLAETLMSALRYPAVPQPEYGQIMLDALTTYHETTGADVSGKSRAIPYAFPRPLTIADKQELASAQRRLAALFEQSHP